MNIQEQITEHLQTLSAIKRAEMEMLHERILLLLPNTKAWFLDGKDASGKVVSNPNIGYGSYTIKYADGKTKEFYQIGISANTTGISVYIMGIPDKNYLPDTYVNRIGKATVTSYCIKFKALKDIDLSVLEVMILDGVRLTNFTQRGKGAEKQRE